MEQEYLVVCTSHHDIFMGLGVMEGAGDTLTLTEAQQCVYYPRGGDARLASHGPDGSGYRVGPVVSRVRLNGVSKIMAASDAVVAVWRREPWS